MAESKKPIPEHARALGTVPSGLFILTTGRGDAATGALVSFVQQVGFEPPAVVVAVKAGRPIEALLRDTGRFCLSTLDDSAMVLLRHFAGPQVTGLLERLGLKDGEAIESSMVTRSVRRALKKLEATEAAAPNQPA